MANTYNAINLNKKEVEPVLLEMFYGNPSIEKGLVTLEEDVKNSAIFTEGTGTVVIKAYTASGVPSQGGGGTSIFDTEVTPKKLEVYEELTQDQLRPSRFGRAIKSSAWETASSDFEKILFTIIQNKFTDSLSMQMYYGATTATKTAVAALTAGTANNQVSAAEKALIAAAPTTLYDSFLTKMIYNNSNAAGTNAVGGRTKVAGTTITSLNIGAEYDKLFIGIPPLVYKNTVKKGASIMAPYAHKQMIIAFNQSQTYRDKFVVNPNGDVYYGNEVKIEFIDLPANVMFFASKENLYYLTDLLNDFNRIDFDRIARNREDYFYKMIFAGETHVANQSEIILYVG